MFTSYIHFNETTIKRPQSHDSQNDFLKWVWLCVSCPCFWGPPQYVTEKDAVDDTSPAPLVVTQSSVLHSDWRRLQSVTPRRPPPHSGGETDACQSGWTVHVCACQAGEDRLWSECLCIHFSSGFGLETHFFVSNISVLITWNSHLTLSRWVRFFFKVKFSFCFTW